MKDWLKDDASKEYPLVRCTQSADSTSQRNIYKKVLPDDMSQTYKEKDLHLKDISPPHPSDATAIVEVFLSFRGLPTWFEGFVT